MRRSCCVLIFLLTLVLVSNVFAGTQVYTEWRGLEGGDWNTAANWSAGVPQLLDPPGGPQGATFGKAGFKGWSSNGGRSPGLYAGTTVAVDQIVVGGTTPGTAQYGYLNIDGGTLNVSEFGHIGNAAADNGTITINSGTLNCGTMISSLGNLKVGYNGVGTLNMNGGTINLTSFLTIAALGPGVVTSQGTVNLYGGSIFANDLFMNGGLGKSKMVITDGVLVLNTDRTAKLAPWLNTLITTTKPGWTVVASYDGFAQTTTVFAIPEPATICLLGFGVLGLFGKKK